jgi:hypothetical protein
MGLSWNGSGPVADNWMPRGHQLLDLVATGRLIRPPGDFVPIYVMEGDARRQISNGTIFTNCGYGLDAVAVLSQATLPTIPSGPALNGPPCPKPTFDNGVLLTGSDGRVWVVKNSKRHWVTSGEAFASCGYRWPDLNRLGDSIIAGVTPGPDVVPGGCP